MKKFLPYILILVILLGVTAPYNKLKAQAATGLCTYYTGTTINPIANQEAGKTQAECFALNTVPTLRANWSASGVASQGQTLSTDPKEKSVFQDYVEKQTCIGVGGSISGCALQISYVLFYQIPAGLLWMAASFFNVLLPISLDSKLFSDSVFVKNGWAIVRDLSNIFFILILIYTAIELILGLSHDAKKNIIYVVSMAIVINYSMFFTSIPIDSSNILSLVFYNKIEVSQKLPDGKLRPYASSNGEKDVAGGMVAAFDPTTILTPDFFQTAGTITIPGQPPIKGEISTSMLIWITILAGGIMYFAAYALFVSGLAFLGRMLEFFVLIIFSPFAFMSFAEHTLKGVSTIGWSAWSKRLLETSFMAPIFMFFMYFIFLMINSKIFANVLDKSTGIESTAKKILLVTIPALMIMILLLKATSFAKKMSGTLGEMIIKGGQAVAGMAAGVAVGAATGGAALAARGTVGRLGANLAENNWLRDIAATSGFARGALRLSNKIGSSSFDLRKAPGMEDFAKSTGVNLGTAKTFGLGPREGFTQQRTKYAKEKDEFANKFLSTTDKGKDTLAMGGMSDKKAERIIKQIRLGKELNGERLSIEDEFNYYNQLKGSGLSQQELGKVAGLINSARRHDFANGLDNSIFASKRMAARKVRKNAKTLSEEASLQHTLEHLGHHVGGGQGGGHKEEKKAHKEEKHDEGHKEEKHDEGHGGGGGHGGGH